ncbi:MAG: LemA family protein [Oscillospiraceae bacterium]|jgi:LemA protein|nr:LemA family protein [Oscillospiraceae bacterium]
MNPVFYVLIAVAAILLIAFISISNGLNRAKVKIEEASSDIDVSLTKRYDVLTKMVDVVKSYAKYEKETIFETIQLRKNMTMQEKNEANRLMGESFERIRALAENYPDLKASANYNTLQKAIADVEEHLQASRRLYNANVSSYNQKIATFPTSLVAGLKGLTKEEFFSAEEHKRQDVRMDL